MVKQTNHSHNNLTENINEPNICHDQVVEKQGYSRNGVPEFKWKIRTMVRASDTSIKMYCCLAAIEF